MAYRVIGQTKDLYQGFEKRKGLEGPFAYPNGRILYYDPQAGQYWDPRTDFFVENQDVADLQQQIFNHLAGKRI